MHVFVTGASGGIGSAVVPELIAAGHRVTGLARSEESARAITAMGAEPLPGSLADLDILRAGARAAEGVLNLAFGNDFTNVQADVEEEAAAVDALGEALVGTGKPFVLASGTPAICFTQ